MLSAIGVNTGAQVAIVAIALSCIAACGSVDSVASGRRFPVAALTILSGGNQTVRRGSSLPIPIVVRLDTAGVPAQGAELKFVVQAALSPGPNHTWYAETDGTGVASANGIVTNTGVSSATITISYIVCVVPGFKSCSELATHATTSTPLVVTP